jgi:hypothetical protein
MRGDAYRPPVPEVTRRETHMSEVFLAGDRAYKLKKPVRFGRSARRELGPGKCRGLPLSTHDFGLCYLASGDVLPPL